MDNDEKCKFQYVLNQEHGKDLHDTYGDKVIKKVKKNKSLKIRTKSNNYIMLKQMSEQLEKNILKLLGDGKRMGFAYLGYLHTLLNTLDYTNRVNFNVYKSYDISDSMIKVIRGKFKELDIVKKFGNDFYLNPNLATKGQDTPKYILDLFSNESITAKKAKKVKSKKPVIE